MQPFCQPRCAHGGSGRLRQCGGAAGQGKALARPGNGGIEQLAANRLVRVRQHQRRMTELRALGFVHGHGIDTLNRIKPAWQYQTDAAIRESERDPEHGALVGAGHIQGDADVAVHQAELVVIASHDHRSALVPAFATTDQAGLMQGAGIRIVTPGSRLGMPEVNIGLYPDVGGSWFLARLPGKLGLFLGLTASTINATDALDLDLADRVLLDSQQDDLLDGLAMLNWHEQSQQQLHSLLKALENQALAELPEAQWLTRRGRIDELLDTADLPQAWQAISALHSDSDLLLARAAKTLAGGCPLTGHLVWEQINRAKQLSLAEVFQMEYAISLNCCRHPEFPEGVRSRLIDKDHAPRWHWPDVASIPQQVIDAHFAPAWDGEHPLADL